jgi:hypothetical protein
MLRKMLGWGSRDLEMTASNENAPEIGSPKIGLPEIGLPEIALPEIALHELPQVETVRALATGAALAASVDASPAVLVNLYDYAHRYGDGRRRRTA